MVMYTDDVAIVRVEDVGELVVTTVVQESVAMQVARVVRTNSHDSKIPVVTDDPAAAWTAEGSEITPDDVDLTQIYVTPPKVAGLTIITRELADDSSPEAANVVGQALSRDIARRVDEAFFGSRAGTVAPDGLPDPTGVQTVSVTGGYTSLDPFAEAISLAETVGATTTAFVANPATALVLAKIEEATGSVRPLLGADATSAGERRLLGTPLYVSPFVAANVVWAVPGDRSFVVLREGTRVEVDRSAYFSSDRVGVRAVMRVGFGFPHAAAVVKIAPAAP